MPRVRPSCWGRCALVLLQPGNRGAAAAAPEARAGLVFPSPSPSRCRPVTAREINASEPPYFISQSFAARPCLELILLEAAAIGKHCGDTGTGAGRTRRRSGEALDCGDLRLSRAAGGRPQPAPGPGTGEQGCRRAGSGLRSPLSWCCCPPPGLRAGKAERAVGDGCKVRQRGGIYCLVVSQCRALS